MHVKAKQMAFGGLLLALSIVCMVLGSIIETNTLFLLAAASYFVGIVIREMNLSAGAAFLIAGILLGSILAPNKFYVISYAVMGCYIWMREFLWKRLTSYSGKKSRMMLFWVAKYLIFNILYVIMICFFGEILFTRQLSKVMWMIVFAAGQAGFFIYDSAYEYVQRSIWGKYRSHIF